MKKETGLMFKAPLVLAILSGQKTQTRRIVKWKGLQKGLNLGFSGLHAGKTGDNWVLESNTPTSSEWRCTPTPCPFGKPGDRIYMRETWVDLWAHDLNNWEPIPDGPGERVITPPTYDAKGQIEDHGLLIAYRASSKVEFCDGDGFSGEFADTSDMPCWRPSIHMKKEHARIWLEITGVRVERLQQITEADCIAEGAPGGHGSIPGHPYSATPLEHFRHIWESTGGDWAANPWVWVIDFKTISTTGRPA